MHNQKELFSEGSMNYFARNMLNYQINPKLRLNQDMHIVWPIKLHSIYYVMVFRIKLTWTWVIKKTRFHQKYVLMSSQSQYIYKYYCIIRVRKEKIDKPKAPGIMAILLRQKLIQRAVKANWSSPQTYCLDKYRYIGKCIKDLQIFTIYIICPSSYGTIYEQVL